MSWNVKGTCLLVRRQIQGIIEFILWTLDMALLVIAEGLWGSAKDLRAVLCAVVKFVGIQASVLRALTVEILGAIAKDPRAKVRALFVVVNLLSAGIFGGSTYYYFRITCTLDGVCIIEVIKGTLAETKNSVGKLLDKENEAINRLTDNLNALQRQVAEQGSRSDLASQEITVLQRQVKELTERASRVTTLLSVVDTLETQITEKLADRLDGVPQLNALQERVNSLQNEVEALADRPDEVSMLISKVEALQNQAEVLADRPDEADLLVSGAKELQNQVEKLANRPDEVSTIIGGVKALQSQVVEFASRTDGVASTIIRKNGVKKLQNHVNELEGIANILTNDVKALQKRVRVPIDPSIPSRVSRLEEQGEKLVGIPSKVTTLEKQVKQLVGIPSKVTTLEKQGEKLVGIPSRVTTLEEQGKKLVGIPSKVTTLEKQGEKLVSILGKVVTLTSAVTTLKNQVKELADLPSKVATLTTGMNTLTSTVTTHISDLNESKNHSSKPNGSTETSSLVNDVNELQKQVKKLFGWHTRRGVHANE